MCGCPVNSVSTTAIAFPPPPPAAAQAMASELPVVAVRAGGIPDIITPGDSGELAALRASEGASEWGRL